MELQGTGVLRPWQASCGQGSHRLVKGQEQDKDTYLRTGTGDTVWTVDELRETQSRELSADATDTVQVRDHRGQSSGGEEGLEGKGDERDARGGRNRPDRGRDTEEEGEGKVESWLGHF